MAKRCNATRRDGQPCTAAAQPSGFCFFHDPALAEARVRGRHVGGTNRSNIARFQQKAPKEMRDVLDQLLQALEETYGGQLEPRVATAMATLCGAIVRVYELGELAVRVQALEEREEVDDAYPRTRP
jgi:Family of unknown function (DUF5763)